MNITTLLYVTTGAVGLTLATVAFFLKQHKRFHWLSTGFWAWVAFAIYFFINPLFVAITGTNLEHYQARLSLAGGYSHGLWIALVVVVGVGVFFVAYLRADARKSEPQPWKASGLPYDEKLSPLAMHVMLMFLLLGLYSLVQFRTFTSEQDVLIVGGQFVGDVTGYQASGYNFLFFLVAFLSISSDSLIRRIGSVLMISFVVLSLPHGWSRFTLVSMLLLATQVSVFRSSRRWPRAISVIAIVLLAAILQVRGHTYWALEETPELLGQTTEQTASNWLDILASRDTAMLASFYVESFLHDSIIGYSYGLPTLNYALTGWIPSVLFPEKYFIVDWLESSQGRVPPSISQALYGAKSSLIGDLYANGWIVGVVLGMWILGWISHRLDVILESGTQSQQAIVLVVLSQAWILWGSHMTWVLTRLGFILMPAFALWLIVRRPASRRAADKSRILRQGTAGSSRDYVGNKDNLVRIRKPANWSRY